jgi:hypothetical protein
MFMCCILNYLLLVPDIFSPAANMAGDAHALTPISSSTSCASVLICFLIEKHAWQQEASSSHSPDPAEYSFKTNSLLYLERRLHMLEILDLSLLLLLLFYFIFSACSPTWAMDSLSTRFLGHTQ